MKLDHRDEGSVTLLATTAMSAILFIFMAIGFGFRLAYEYRTVRQAADLSALAGAAVSAKNPADACSMAVRIAEENQAKIEDCTVLIGEVEVRVHSTKMPSVKAIARAGIF